MRKFIFCLFIWFFSLTVVFAETPATLLKILNIQQWKTEKGATVYFVKAPEIPMLDIRVDFAAGSSYDGSTYGLASLVNNLIGEGAAGLNADQIAQHFDDIGARFSTEINRDKATAYLRTLVKPQYLTSAINTFALALDKPSFSNKAIRRVKNQMLASIKVDQQNPGSVARNTFYKVVYKNQPYAHPVNGTLDSLGVISQKEIKQFYQRYYVAKNANIIMVGDISRQKAEAIAQKIDSHLLVGQVAPALKSAPQVKNHEIIHVNFPAKQTSIVIGQVGIRRDNVNYYSLQVANHILGGLPLNSLLYKAIREKRGLAYYAFSHFSPLALKGPFSIALKTRADQTQQAIAVVNHVLTLFVENGPTKGQLALAKKNLVGGFPLALSTNRDRLNIVSNMAFYHRPLDSLDHYRDRIDDVTMAQVKQAFSQQISLKNMVVVTVGPKNNLSIK